MEELNNRILSRIILGVLFISCFSCQQVYVPNMQNVPMSKKKGDLKLMLNPNNYQASYTITDNIGVIGNGFFRSNEWSLNDTKFISSTALGEIGAGYYSVLGDNGIFEAYIGGGMGKITLTEEVNTSNISTKQEFSAGIQKLFLQPSIGYSSEYIDFAFTPKITNVNFNNIDTTNYTKDDLEQENLHKVDNTGFLFIEPGVTFRAGIPEVKGHIQMAYSFKETAAPLNHKNLILNFGAHLNITNIIEAFSN